MRPILDRLPRLSGAFWRSRPGSSPNWQTRNSWFRYAEAAILLRSIPSLALAFVLFGSICTVTAQIPAPLAKTFSRELRPAVDALISEFRGLRQYKAADFPLSADRFGQF